MNTFVIFTPTYNRAETLGRTYKSLCKQTYKDFWWLIVDDGSSDNTKEIVSQWTDENKIKIKYIYKENGGKHTAFLTAKPLLSGKYYICIDSDDELTPNALEVFCKTWETIENEGKANEIALVKAQTTEFYKLIDKKPLLRGLDCLDMSYLDYSIKYDRREECITSIRMTELSKCFDIQTLDKIWYGDKIKYYGESVLWARAGRFFKTRYISDVLRIRYDNTISLTRNSSSKDYNHLYAYMVTTKYFCSENYDYLMKYRKMRTIKSIIIYSIMGLLLDIPIKELSKELKITFLKNLMKVSLIVSYPTYLFFKYLIRK